MVVFDESHLLSANTDKKLQKSCPVLLVRTKLCFLKKRQALSVLSLHNADEAVGSFATQCS